jgi:hypothetical protein
MNAMVHRVTDVAKDSLDKCPMSVTWCMHVKSCLMHNIGDV